MANEETEIPHKLEKRISFIKDDELAPIPENSTLSKESTMFIEYTIHPDGIHEEELSVLPPHAVALYEYFGRAAAEDFLHPKMEAGGGGSSKAGGDANFKRERTNISQISTSTDVESLWSSLRADSQMRLIRRDARISERLKKAYNAFARQCLAHHENPPERNFAQNDDLNELSQLIADSQVEQVRDRRRKKELMFRLAHVHENQYRILEHNNPLPDLTNRSGQDGVASYIPSWSDRYPIGDVEETLVEQVVKPVKPKKHNKPSLGDLALEKAGLVEKKPRPPSYALRRYHFLGDKEYSGSFSARIRDQFALQNDPIEVMLKQANERREEMERSRRFAHIRENAEGAQLLPGFALRRRSAHLGNLSEVRKSEVSPKPRHGHSAPSQSSRGVDRSVLFWEPLSLGALLEYKRERGPVMEKEKPFRAGATHWWQVEEAKL